MNTATSRHEEPATADASDPQPWMGRWVEIGVIGAFWAAIALIGIAQRAMLTKFGEPGELLPGEAPQAFLEYGLWALLTPGIFWLARRFPLDGKRWIRHLALHTGIALVITIIVSAFAHASFHAMVDVGRDPSFSITRSVVGLRFLSELIVYVIVLVAGFARDYLRRYRERRAEAAMLKAQLAEARLKALRMQLNPHFLFNTLHTIATHLERDPKGTRRMIARLSELLRYALDRKDDDEVPLRDELRFLDGYFEIQRVRFEDRLTVQKDIEPAAMDALVPNLILQPLVENAVKHGVSPSETGGRIELRAWVDGERLHLRVRDNGPGPTEASRQSGNGIGLQTTRERLQTLYGGDQQLTVSTANGGGFATHIMLPYHTRADFHTSAVSD